MRVARDRICASSSTLLVASHGAQPASITNPRKTRAIYQHERKSDRRDALMLARIVTSKLTAASEMPLAI